MKVAIVSGSVYGTAEEVARLAERQLKAAGLEAWYKANMSLDELLAFAPDAFLTVTSTTGMGEVPDNLLPLYSELRDRLPAWSGKPAAVLALGDRQYRQFCGFAHRLRAWLDEQGARSLFTAVEVDNGDQLALASWRQALAGLTGRAGPAAARSGGRGPARGRS